MTPRSKPADDLAAAPSPEGAWAAALSGPARASGIAGLNLRPIETATMHDQVYREIRRQIMAGQFLPGQTFSMQKLSRMLDVSTTPVREALRRLATEQALEILPKRGIRVPVMTASRFEEIGTVRVALEGLLAANAARRVRPEELAEISRILVTSEDAARHGDVPQYLGLNQAFHFAIYEAARSEVLMPIIATIWLQIGPVQGLYTRSGVNIGANFHHDAFAALGRGDPDGAREAIVKDISVGTSFLLERLKQEPADPV